MRGRQPQGAKGAGNELLWVTAPLQNLMEREGQASKTTARKHTLCLCPPFSQLLRTLWGPTVRM